MTVFKKILVFSFLILIQSSCSSETVNQQQDNIVATYNQSSSHNYLQYLGEWSVDTYDSNKEPISSLSIDINDISISNIEGKYCYITKYGKKIDCLNDFKGNAINDKQYLITFDSSFDNVQGEATLTLEKDKVIWTLKKFPADLGVSARKHAVLLRDINQQVSTSTSDTIPEFYNTEYIVNVKKAFIYKQPDLNSKTSSYFIEGDEIKVLSTKDNWIETSYLKGSKTGWLHLKDLEEKSHSNSPLKESTSSKIKDTSKDIQLVNSNQDKKVISKNGIGNVSLGQKFKPNEFDEELSYLEGIDNCFFTTSKQYTDYKHTLSFQVINNIITGINVNGNDIANGNSFKSYTGIKIGDTVETVLKLHDKQPDEILDSPYTDDPIFIYWTNDSKKTGIRYDISSNKVLSMSLNYNPHIRYFEGCG
ncbi:MAG: hypothetical protein ACI8R1_001546 [Psychrobacter glaciei]|jgi:hypothetical protein|uniref:hypothetical protein n=1 Tax=Psychrobacter glaciei TaxID=619771 RepID=UPI0039E4FA3E